MTEESNVRQLRREGLLEDWRAVPRSKMFTRVILAVDCVHGDALVHGDGEWTRYVENVLFPFLEAEKEKAE